MVVVQLKRASVQISTMICFIWLGTAAWGAVGFSIRSANKWHPTQVKHISDGGPIYDENSQSELSDHQARLDVLDEQITELRQTDANTVAKVDSLSGKIDVIRDDISTMKGVGIGIGALLGFLQSIQVFLQVKRKRREDDLEE